jgi:predicted Zn-dependent peptidase
MSSRLFINLRERNGLCYYVRSWSDQYTDVGYLVTQAGVPVDKVDKAVSIIVDEYKRLAAEPIGAAELKRVKQFMTGRFVLSMDGSDDIANWYGQQLVMNIQQPGGRKRRLVNPAEHARRIKAVTAADIQRVAKQIFTPKGLNLAIIGPYDKPEKFLKLLK